MLVPPQSCCFFSALGKCCFPPSRARRHPALKHLQRFKSETFSLWQQSWVKRRSAGGGARLAVPGGRSPSPSPSPRAPRSHSSGSRPRPLRGCSGRRDAGDGEVDAGWAGAQTRQKTTTKKVEMGGKEGGAGAARAGGHLCRHRAAMLSRYAVGFGARHSLPQGAEPFSPLCVCVPCTSSFPGGSGCPVHQTWKKYFPTLSAPSSHSPPG